MNRYACIRERYAAIEAEATAASAAVITIAGPIGDYFRKKYGVKRVEVMATGFDRQDFAGVSGQVCLDPAFFQVVFTGRFALSHEYNPVGFFFTAVRRLLEEQPALARKLKLHLLGEYRAGELARLKDLIGEGIIEVHGFVPRRLALAFQRAADVLLIITPSDRTSATSAKIFEYLAAEKPILALTDGTVLAEIIRETGAGWLVHPEKSAEIKDMLGRLLSDREFLLSLKPDRQAIERYSTASQMAKLGRLLDEISTERR
jgi:glycosyltransferase involved in cell wall biosynthesis